MMNRSMMAFLVVISLLLIASCGGKCDPPCFAKCDGNSLIVEKCSENKCVPAARVDCGGPCAPQFMQLHGKMMKDASGQIMLGGKCANGNEYGGEGTAGGAANAI